VFHRILEGVQGTKILRTPNLKQIKLIQCRSRDGREITTIFPEVPVIYSYFHEDLQILSSSFHHKPQF
jgi:hypothetical protein